MDKDKTLIQKKRHLKKLGYPVDIIPEDKIEHIYPKAIVSYEEKIKFLQNKQIPVKELQESEIELYYRRIIGMENDKSYNRVVRNKTIGGHISDSSISQSASNEDGNVKNEI